MWINITGIIVGAFIIVVATAAMGSLLNIGPVMTEAIDMSVHGTDLMRRTKISIESTSADNSDGGTEITIYLRNRGSVSVADMSKIKVLVEYTDADLSKVSRLLSYTNGVPGDNQWSVDSISPDEFNPGMWDPKENAVLLLRVAPELQESSTGRVRVVTPTGIGVEGNFSN